VADADAFSHPSNWSVCSDPARGANCVDQRRQLRSYRQVRPKLILFWNETYSTAGLLPAVWREHVTPAAADVATTRGVGNESGDIDFLGL
jgi:hypothetical protein